MIWPTPKFIPMSPLKHFFPFIANVWEEISFLYPLRFIRRGLQCKLTNDRIMEEKTSIILMNIFCVKESNRKEVKLKEVVRLGGLYSIFKKGKGVWRKVSRKWMGKLMGDKRYFHKVCLCRLTSVPILHLWWQESLSSSWFGRGGPGLRENSCPAFREKRGGKISSCICWFSMAFSSKPYLCQSGIFWGGIFFF